jgi:hypothetical protein
MSVEKRRKEETHALALSSRAKGKDARHAREWSTEIWHKPLPPRESLSNMCLIQRLSQLWDAITLVDSPL